MKVLLVIALIGCVYGDKPIDGHHHHHDDHHHDAAGHESLRITPASTTILSNGAAPALPAAPAEEIIFLAPEEPLPQEVIRQAAPQQLVPQQVSQESQSVFVQNSFNDAPLLSSGGFVPIDSPQKSALPPTRVNLPSINQGEPLPLEPLRAAAPDGASSYVSFNGASNFELDGRHQPQPFREESHHQHHNAHQPQPVHHHNAHQPQPVHLNAHQPQPVHHSVHQQSYSAPEPAPVYNAPEPAPVYHAPQPTYGAPVPPMEHHFKGKGQHFQKPRPELPKVKGGLGLLKVPSFEQVVKGSTKIFKDLTKDLPDIDDIKESFKFEMPEFDIKGAFDSAYEDVKYGFDSFKDTIDIFDFAGKGEKGEEYKGYDYDYVPNYQYQQPMPHYEQSGYEKGQKGGFEKGGFEKGLKGGFEKGQKGGFEKGEKGGHFDWFNKGEKGNKGHFDWFNKGDKASKGTFDLFDKGEKGSKGHFDWFNKGDKAAKGGKGGHFDFIKAHFNKGNKGNKGHFNKAPKDTYAPPPVAPQPTYGHHVPPQQHYGPPPQQSYGAPQPSYHLESSVSEPVRVL